jgi:hypothetical protein
MSAPERDWKGFFWRLRKALVILERSSGFILERAFTTSR